MKEVSLKVINFIFGLKEGYVGASAYLFAPL